MILNSENNTKFAPINKGSLPKLTNFWICIPNIFCQSKICKRGLDRENYLFHVEGGLLMTLLFGTFYSNYA